MQSSLNKARTARLPDCDGQAADAISAYTLEKMEDAPKLFKILRSQSVQIYGYVFHDINGPTHGQALRIPWCLFHEICMLTHSLSCCGKDNLRKVCWD